MVDSLPRSIRGNDQQAEDLVRSAHLGRLGLDCGVLFADCPAAEWRFMDAATKWATDPLVEEDVLLKIVTWAFTKQRFRNG